MKYINLNNNFGVDREKDKNTSPDNELTMNWLLTGIITGYPTLNSNNRRIWVGLLDKADKVRKDKLTYLPINEVECLFIKKGFDKGEVPKEQAKFITIAEDAFLNATDELPTNDAQA